MLIAGTRSRGRMGAARGHDIVALLERSVSLRLIYVEQRYVCMLRHVHDHEIGSGIQIILTRLVDHANVSFACRVLVRNYLIYLSLLEIRTMIRSLSELCPASGA